MSASSNMTASEYQESLKPAKRSKYGAKRVTIDGIDFDSKAEGARYVVLRDLQRAGKIHDLRRQVPYPITVGPSVLVGNYRADFVYWEEGATAETVEDVKGFDTPLSKFKRKCVEAAHGVKIQIVRAK